jgi:anti-sigma-K factor RskA
MQQIEQADTTPNDAANPLWLQNPANDAAQPALTDVRYKRWKTWAGFSSAIAAALALFIVFDPSDVVPMVHLPSSQTIAQQVQDIAVLSSSDKTPAWIVRREQDQLVLLNLNAAAVPQQHDLELWTIQGNQPPQSLGVLQMRNGQAVLSNIRAGQISKDSVLAISLEPVGGSPTGAPTGEVLYTGNIAKATV